MSTNYSCSVFEIFLGLLTGLVWFLLAVLGVVGRVLALIGLGGSLANIITIIIALVGFIAILFLGFCILKKVWGCCFRRNC